MARASIRQVAEAAGVSTMTVSRVLRGEGGSQYQEQVLSAVRELDYVPVRSAIQNRHVKTNVLGVLLDDEFAFESSIGQQTFDGVRRAAFAHNYDLLMLRPQHQQPLEKQKIPFLDRRCDGFIFVVPYERAEILELLVQHEFPAVTCYSTDVPRGIGWVVPDNESAVRQAVQLLREQGHRRIAFYGAGNLHSDARERVEAFERETRACGIEGFSYDLSSDEVEGGSRCKYILKEIIRNNITSIICHNDERAIGLSELAREQGLKIPQDLSIIGIDNMPEAETQGLTTFSNPFYEIGFNAAEAVISLLQDGSVQANRKRLPMALVKRHSVAPVQAS